MTAPTLASAPPDQPSRLRAFALAALTLSAALASAVKADAEVEDEDAREERIWAVASALATADGVREHCPGLKVDDGVESRLIASTGLDRTALTAHPSYRDQAAAEAWIRDYAGDRGLLACDTALSTHEDVASGLVKWRR